LLQSAGNAADIYYTSNAALRPVIATAAPHKLRNLLSTEDWDEPFDWDRMSQLARKTIESQLESYAAYVAGRVQSRVPSLVEIAAAMIPKRCESDDLARIPSHILDKISYRSMRRLWTSLALEPKVPPLKRQKLETNVPDIEPDIDEW
jgi:hypothetical protein